MTREVHKPGHKTAWTAGQLDYMVLQQLFTHWKKIKLFKHKKVKLLKENNLRDDIYKVQS